MLFLKVSKSYEKKLYYFFPNKVQIFFYILTCFPPFLILGISSWLGYVLRASLAKHDPWVYATQYTYVQPGMLRLGYESCS